MLRQLWKGLSTKTSARTAARGAARRPALEALEYRCVPTAYTWVRPGGGLWSNPANWSSALPGTVPGVGSDVVYNSSASSTDDLTVPSPGLNSLLIGTSAGTLTLSGSLQQSPGTFINQEGGTVLVTGVLVNGGGYNQFAGTLNVADVVTNTGAYDLFGGSVVGTGKFLNGASGQQGNLLISTPGSATVGVNLENFSQITWSSGNVDLEATLTNFSGGTIAVNTPATLSGTNGYLVNNYGASITASTGAAATIDVPLGPSDTNYGLINVTKGGLVFGLFTQFTNEGRIGASVAGSGSSVTFDGPYQQLANTQKSSYTPLAASFAGDTLTFQQGAVVNAGTVSVLGTANVNGPIFGSTLVVNPGGTVSVGGTLNMVGWVGDSGVVWISGGTVNLSALGQFNVNAGGKLNAVSPSTNQNCTITGGAVFDYGTVVVYQSSTLVIIGTYSQTAGALTDLNGFLDYTSFNVLTSLPAVFKVSQGIDVAGGEFLITNAYVETGASQFVLEANAALVFQNSSGLGSGFFQGNALILGALNLENQYGTNIGFANNLTLGSASVSMTITMNLFDNITIGGVTDFANCTVAFNNVSPSGSVPYLYEPFDFATVPVVGTPNIPLPAGDSWWITYNQNKGWMQVKILM
jgi:hypothetical protein